MKLTYWVAYCRHDSECYSIIAKTKKECAKLREERGEEYYDKPQKATIYYKDAFDLFDQATGEGGGRALGVGVE